MLEAEKRNKKGGNGATRPVVTLNTISLLPILHPNHGQSLLFLLVHSARGTKRRLMLPHRQADLNKK